MTREEAMELRALIEAAVASLSETHARRGLVQYTMYEVGTT